MALDTTGNWVAGDDLRLVEALMLPFGTYILDCAHNCMKQLEDMSPEAVLRVRSLLDEYEAAEAAENEQNLGDTEGKVLVKADVLEWQVVGGTGSPSGPQQLQNKLRGELWNYFAFCSCLGSLNPNSGGHNGGTSLVRS